MKRALTILLAGLSLVFSTPAVIAADAPVEKAAVKTVATGKKSMTEKGSYHRVHATKEKLDCGDCHETGPLPDNTIKLTLHKPLAKGSPGPVSTENCHECHGKPGKPGKNVMWYAPKAK